jgi:hypothetical protein
MVVWKTARHSPFVIRQMMAQLPRKRLRLTRLSRWKESGPNFEIANVTLSIYFDFRFNFSAFRKPPALRPRRALL